jgi:hypothetical protein
MAVNVDNRRTDGTPTRRTGRAGSDAGLGARMVNVVLGAWLFISAFLWPHTEASFANTWVVGALTVAFALWAMKAPSARYLNTALSMWLFFSTFAMVHLLQATLWNNAIVAVAIFIASLVPSRSTDRRQRPPTRRYAEV